MGALKFGFSMNGISLPEQVEQTIVRRTVAVPAPRTASVPGT